MKALLLVLLFVSACGYSGLNSPKDNPEAYIPICIVNESIESLSIYYGSLSIGRLRPNETRYLYVPSTRISASEYFRARSIANANNTLLGPIQLLQGSKWEWRLDNSTISNQLSMMAKETTACDK